MNAEISCYAIDPDGKEVEFMATATVTPAVRGTYNDPPEGGTVEDIEIFCIDEKGKKVPGPSLDDEEIKALGFDMDKIENQLWECLENCDEGDY